MDNKISQTQKIEILKRLMLINFKANFGKEYTVGLCTLFRRVTNYEDLYTYIPELAHHVPEEYTYGFWWEHKGYFKPWWERHKAIRSTINKLKKS